MEIRVTLWGVLLILAMGLGAGCKAQDAKQEPADISKTEILNPHQTTASMPKQGTMSYIWWLRKNGKQEELIEEVNKFVELNTDSNAIGTCLFLKADSLRLLKKYPEATNLFNKVITDYPESYWKHVQKEKDKDQEKTIYVQPLCKIGIVLAEERDTSNFPETSEGFTVLAWKYLIKKRNEPCRRFAMECIRQFETDAKEQQKLHDEEYGESLPRLPLDPEEARPFLEKYWALYDVGTCWFISGQSYQEEAQMLEGEIAKEGFKKAIECYDHVLKEYKGAQCFDPHGPWYWSVAKGAKEQKAIASRKL